MSALRTTCLLLAALIAMPAIVSAQDAPVGEMTFQVSATAPAALAEQAPMMATLPATRFQIGSNGKQLGMMMSIVPDGSNAMTAALADASVRILWRTSVDSVTFAVAVPAAFRAMLAGMIASGSGETPPAGYRLAVKIPNVDSIVAANRDKLDSVKANGFVPRPLGTKSTVAGLQCENWQVDMPIDSTKTPADTLQMCLIESNKLLFNPGDWLAKRYKFDDEMNKQSAEYFGGRTMIPVRVATSSKSFVMELVSMSKAAPPAAFFEVPADYKPVDPKELPIPGMNAKP